MSRVQKWFPHDILIILWTEVSTSLLELKSKSYLVVVDYTANLSDISLFPNKRSATIATYVKRILYQFIIRKNKRSDNGPEYIGKDYKLFAKQWDFKYNSAISPYPRSNWQIERTIQTIRKH